MARSDPQVNIRLPADLKARLEVAAEAAARSLTAEIIVRLESSFRHGIHPERGAVETDQAQVRLRPFQQQLFEGVRKIVRMEALLGAPKLSKEQKVELAQLKGELGLDD